jgi:hypothetical protein
VANRRCRRAHWGPRLGALRPGGGVAGDCARDKAPHPTGGDSLPHGAAAPRRGSVATVMSGKARGMSAVLCAMVMGAATAHAHHSTAPTGRVLTSLARGPAAWLRLGGVATGLSAGGSLFSLELDGQVGVTDNLAARLRAPFHLLRHDGEEEMGPGDVSIGGEAFLRLARLRLALGADVELPTGDSDAGLGHGTITLAPMAAAQVDIAAGFIALAQSSLLIDLDEPPAGALDPVEQQDELELRAAAGPAWQRGPFAVTGLMRVSVPLAEEDSDPFATGSLIGELALASRVRASVLAELPLGGDRRLDWRAGAALTYSFDD